MTMDSLCEQYYDKTPYSYCADNPMRYGDVNGDSIWFTSQMNKNNELIGITMHVTGKVMDASNSVNMKSAIKNISSGIQRAFKGNIDGVSFNTDVQLSEAKSMNDVENRDHLFVLTDKIIQPNDGHTYGMSNDFGSTVAFIEAGLFSGLYDRALGSRNYGTYTAVHEFGHLANLEHVKKITLI